MKHIRIILLFFFSVLPVFSETIVLKDGKTFETSGCWEEHNKIYFFRYGQTIGIPKEDVLRIEGAEENVQESTVSPVYGTSSEGSSGPESLDAEYRALAREMAALYKDKDTMNEFEWEEKNTRLKNRANHLAQKIANYYQTSSRE